MVLLDSLPFPPGFSNTAVHSSPGCRAQGASGPTRPCSAAAHALQACLPGWTRERSPVAKSLQVHRLPAQAAGHRNQARFLGTRRPWVGPAAAGVARQTLKRVWGRHFWTPGLGRRGSFKPLAHAQAGGGGRERGGAACARPAAVRSDATWGFPRLRAGAAAPISMAGGV